jgi:hypothetical protein
MKAYGTLKVQVHAFLTLALDGVRGVLQRQNISSYTKVFLLWCPSARRLTECPGGCRLSVRYRCRARRHDKRDTVLLGLNLALYRLQNVTCDSHPLVID